MHVFVTPLRLFAFVLSLTFQKDVHPRNVLIEMISPSPEFLGLEKFPLSLKCFLASGSENLPIYLQG